VVEVTLLDIQLLMVLVVVVTRVVTIVVVVVVASCAGVVVVVALMAFPIPWTWINRSSSCLRFVPIHRDGV
jgi:hypothetical protein